MAQYSLIWRSSAARELKRIDRQVLPRIVESIEQLAATPFPSGTRKLQGALHTYRIRIGDYRVIYEVSDDLTTVTIARVRHRKDVYK